MLSDTSAFLHPNTISVIILINPSCSGANISILGRLCGLAVRCCVADSIQDSGQGGVLVPEHVISARVVPRIAEAMAARTDGLELDCLKVNERTRCDANSHMRSKLRQLLQFHACFAGAFAVATACYQ